MIGGVILESASIGVTLGNMISSWQQAGFFSYLLPFLLIFALVFGILTRIQIFKENRAINAIIAAVVGLMALQVPKVSQFFAEIFPRLGIGLAIILVLMILAGFFADPDSPVVNYVLLTVGVIIVIVVLVQTSGSLGLSSGEWWANNWQVLVGIAFILLLVILIVAGSSTPQPGQPPHKFVGFWARPPGTQPGKNP